MAALEIVMVVAAVLTLFTAFAYIWQRLGLFGSGSTRSDRSDDEPRRLR